MLDALNNLPIAEPVDWSSSRIATRIGLANVIAVAGKIIKRTGYHVSSPPDIGLWGYARATAEPVVSEAARADNRRRHESRSETISPKRSAMCTSAATDRTCIFSMTRAR